MLVDSSRPRRRILPCSTPDAQLIESGENFWEQPHEAIQAAMDDDYLLTIIVTSHSLIIAFSKVVQKVE